jgi:hypothetical protein
VNPSAGQAEDSRTVLLPHQAALVDTVFNPASKRIILLRGQVGLGKSTALVALAARLLQERPAARVLFLVPRGVFQKQIDDRLRRADIPTMLVDRYRFREMLDSATGSEFWPAGVVAVLGQDFAGKPDVLDKLIKAHWELVIVDEAHRVRGVHTESLRSLEGSAERVVLATTAVRDVKQNALPVEDTTVVEWQRESLVDHEGMPLGKAPRRILHEVPFSLTQGELSLGETVKQLGGLLGRSAKSQGPIANTMLRSLQSSPDALGGLLRRLSDRLATKDGLQESPTYMDFEAPENQLDRSIESSTANETVLRLLRQALDGVDEITLDSKFCAFWELFSHLVQTQAGSKRICIVTDFLATLYYLSAAIQFDDTRSLFLDGETMTTDDIEKNIRSFANGEGILVATRASLSGEDLSSATDLVLYDIPTSRTAIEEVLAVFEPFGRKSRLSVYALLPVNSAGDSMSESLRFLREMLGSVSGTQ